MFAVADDDQIISPESVSLRLFDTDAAESECIAAEIAHGDLATWGETAVLGRTRSLLVPIQQALIFQGVKAVIAQRRDRFISPQFTWLQACLNQALHSNDSGERWRIRKPTVLKISMRY